MLGAFTVGLAVSISLAETALVGLALVLLLTPRAAAPARPRWPLIGPMLIFAAWTLVSALASSRPLASLATAKSLLVLATFHVVLNALPDAAAARRFAVTLFALVAVVSLLSIAQVALCPATPPAWPLVGHFLRKCTRARGFYSIYMTLGGVITLVLLAMLPRVLQAGSGGLWLALGWIVGVAALAVTYVRGAWIGFGAGVAATLVLVRERLLGRLLLAAVIFGVLLAAPGALYRLEMLGTLQDNTVIDRVAMIQGGLAMVRDHPLLGVGVGGVKRLYGDYAPGFAMRRHTSHLHNTPLQITVERGIPGLAAWLAIFVAFFAGAGGILRALPRGRDEDRALVLGCLVAIAGFLIAGLFEYNFGDTEVLLVACALMALPYAVAR